MYFYDAGVSVKRLKNNMNVETRRCFEVPETVWISFGRKIEVLWILGCICFKATRNWNPRS